MGRCKFYKEKEQVSYNRGLTWEDIVPYMYRKGDLYEVDSNDCATHERWTEVPDGFICEDGKKYQKEIREISEDNLVFDIKFPLEYRKGRVLENDSIECNFKWYGRYTTSSIPHPERYRDPYKIILCYNNGDILSSNDVYYDNENYYVYSGYVGTCVRMIAAGAFAGHSSLSSITIPNSVEVVGDNAFNGCIGLPVECGIRYADTCAVQAIDGLSPKQGTRFINSNYLSNNGTTGYVKVPDTVLSIGSSAFEDSSRMRISVSGCSLNYIGPKAFKGSGLVGSVNLVSDVYQDEIFDSTFANCSGMTDISLPDGIKTIGEYAFSGCSNLTGITVPSGVTNVKHGAFSGSGIKSLNLQSAQILDYAVNNCKNLESITLDSGYIGLNAFESCDKLTTVNLGKASFNSITRLENSAFYRCRNIKHLKFNTRQFNYNEGLLWGNALKTLELGYDVEKIMNLWTFTFDNAAITSLAIVPPMIHYTAFRGPISVIYVPSISVDAYKSATNWSDDSDKIFPIGSTVITYRAENKLSVDLTSFTPNAIEENYNSNYKFGSITFQNGNQQTIGDSVFYGKTELTQMYISSGITSIGHHAFSYCSHLSSITISDDVTSIGQYAFVGCRELVDIDLPSSLTGISNDVFFQCSGLTNIVIPDSVTSIGERAFWGCSGLTNLTIGSGITSIGHHAFANCENLSGITINAITPPTLGGSAFDNTGNCPIYVPCESVNAYKAEWSTWGGEPVTSRITCLGYRERWINNSDAYECSGTTKMSQEKKQISYDSGFTWTDVVPLETRASLPVKEYYSTDCGYAPSAFSGKYRLTLQDNSVITAACDSTSAITENEIDAYHNNVVKVEIGDCVTSISGGAFSECRNVASIVIPDSVTSIGTGAFQNCTGLTSINIPSGVTEIGNWTFFNCSGLTNITIPDSVTRIGRDAFQFCGSLTSVTIGSGVTYIGESAFTECNSLQSITVEAATPPYVDNSTFAFPTNCPIYVSCNYLDDYINSWRFVAGRLRGIEVQPVTEYRWFPTSGYECSGTTKMAIEKKQKSVDGGIIWTDVIPLETRISSTVIQYNSTNCGYVPPVPPATEKYILTLNDSSVVTAECDSTSAVTSGEVSTQYSGSVVSAEIENCVTSIGNNAFYNCTSLRSVNIPNSVTSIGEGAFSLCWNLENINIPSGVTSIEYNTFQNCLNFTNITIPSGVTSIGTLAFAGCTGLTSIDIPSGVTSIGYGAFSRCRNLTSITVNAITPPSVSNYSFEDTNDCPIYVPAESVNAYKTTGNWSNYASRIQATPTTAITYTSKSDNIFIDLNAFTPAATAKTWDSTTSAGTIEFATTVTAIGYGAFSSVKLTDVNIPNTIISIGDSAFAYCVYLTNINIPDSVTSIGSSFQYCSGLTSVTIGSGVTSIGNYAFNECTGLLSVTVKATTPPTLGSDIFYRASNCPIYVPSESVDTYKAASGWSNYASRIQAIP